MRALSAIAALLAFAGPAHALRVAYESFDYALGELDGRSGGEGLAGSWQADAGATEIADPGTPLTYSAGTITLDGGNRALRLTGNQDDAFHRTLSSAIDADSVYVSFLFRYEGTLNDNDFLGIWHDDVATGSHTDRPNVGIKGNHGDGSGPEDVVARLQLSGSGQAYAAALQPNQTYLILGHLTRSVPGIGNDYDRFEIWVNPMAGASGTPDLVATGSGTVASFSMIGGRTFGLDAADVFWIDDLSYSTGATGFATAIPEPETALLLGIGLAGLGVAGRRRDPPTP